MGARRRWHRAWLVLTALLFAAPVMSTPVTIAVVVARGDPHVAMDKNFVARIFRRQMRIYKHGVRIAPVNLPVTNPLRGAFSQALFGKSPGAMSAFWTRSYFHGISPPYVLQSQEAVLRFVAHTPGAIGYVVSCRLDARVRIVMHVTVVDAERFGIRACPQHNR